MFLECLVFLIITYFLFWSYEIYKKNKFVKHIPGPLPVPFIGLALPTSTAAVLPFYNNLLEKYGRTFKYYLGSQLTVATVDVDLIEDILKSTVHLTKSKMYDMVRYILKDGLIVSKGEKWKQRRRIANSSFNVSILKNFFDTFKSLADTLVEKLREEADKGTNFNICDYMDQYMADAGLQTAFGKKLDFLNGKNLLYLRAIHTVFKLVLIRNFTLWKRFDVLYKFFAKEYCAQKEALEIIESTALKIIEDKRVEYNQKPNNEVNKKDELERKKKTILIEALFAHLSDESILEEINNFLIPSFETNSILGSFALYELATHPDIQEKLYQEIKSAINDDVNEMSYDKLQGMKYLDQVVKETLRLRTPTPAIERKLETDAKFGDTVFPNGTVFTLLLYWVHKDSKHFPDPFKFDPERFNRENQAKMHPYAFIPFSAGPRNCIGQKFAYSEVKTMLARVIMEFKILPVQNGKTELIIGSSLKMKNGILIQLQRRKLTK